MEAAPIILNEEDVRKRRDETASRRSKWMPDRDRPAHDVDDVLVDLPPLRGEALEVREHL